MPLTAKGRKILKKFQEQYGKEEGRKFFYASIVKGILSDKGLHGKGSGKLEKAKRTHARKKQKK
jgi:hypothetical protein